MRFRKKGQVGASVGAILTLIMGVGIAILVLIFTSVMSAQVYQNVESDINAINDSTTKGYVLNANESGFQAYETTGNYMPILVLAVIITIVLGLILSVGRVGVIGGAGGGVL